MYRHPFIDKDSICTEHFSYQEFFRSSTAERLNIRNLPNGLDGSSLKVFNNIGFLCEKVLEPARCELGEPIIITSGYRSFQLNKAVGGAVGSLHKLGLAADIKTKEREDLPRLFDILAKNPNVYECLMYWYKGAPDWIHVSTRPQLDLGKRYINREYKKR